MLLIPNGECKKPGIFTSCKATNISADSVSVAQSSFDLVVKDGLFTVQEGTASSTDVQRAGEALWEEELERKTNKNQEKDKT